MAIDSGDICEKSRPMTPYESKCQLMSRDGSVHKQSRLYQTMTPNFLLQPFENCQFNMLLNGTCVSLHAPFRQIIRRSLENTTRFRENIMRYREIITRYREIITRSRKNITRSRDYLIY